MRKFILGFLVALLLAQPMTALDEQASSFDWETEVVAAGLDHPWGIADLPDGSLLFTERRGYLKRLADGEVQLITEIPDVYVRGEGGLTGLAVDVDFVENRFLYVAFNHEDEEGYEVRIVRYQLNEAWELADATILLTIEASSSGRHSGTQLAMDLDGYLWIGTGDAAMARNPQAFDSLGGKILRVTRDGEAREDNAYPEENPLIFSYGHRNTQGLVLLAEPIDGIYGFSVEHGSSIDDEVNLLVTGNFGWSPNEPYVENVPMTDLARFPEAVEAIWSSGSSTIAPSGAAMLRGAHWGAHQGDLVVGVLKNQRLLILRIEDFTLTAAWDLYGGAFGRIRGVLQAGDGALYFTTDNGSAQDLIVRVTPLVWEPLAAEDANG